jgi:hypothetical protein
MSLYPVLFCDPCGKPTKHRFEIERRAEIMSGKAYEQIFSCDACRSTRRWGLTMLSVVWT